MAMRSMSTRKSRRKGMLEMKDYYDEWACDRESDCVAVIAAGLKCAIDEGVYGE